MELKERKDMDPQYQWDLSTLYADDDAWEKEFAGIGTRIDAAAAFQGKLTSAAEVRAYFDAAMELERRLDNLLTYADLRVSEDRMCGFSSRSCCSRKRYGAVSGAPAI